MKIDIKNNCILPFTGMEIDTDGTISPCCLYKDHLDPEYKNYKIDEYKKYWNIEAPRIQQEFLNGSYSKGCNACFNQKNDITTGLRQTATEIFLEQSYSFKQTHTPEWLDLRFGNYCNLKCIMCHSNLSSQIYAEQFSNYEKFKSIGIKPVEFESLPWWEDSEILNLVLGIVKNAKHINFSGGEPLLAKQFYEILTHANKNCTIAINTNLTKLTDRHLEILKEFKNVYIDVSLDGVGKHHEYVRFGSNWSTIENNIIKLFDNNNVTVVFTYLLQHTSIYTFPDFYNFTKQFDCEVILSTVYSESVGGNHMMTINSALPEDVAKFQNWFQNNNNTKYQSIISQWLDMYSFNEEAHNKFKNYVLLLDQLRGCNFRETFRPNW